MEPNLNIDPDLLNRAFELSGETTKQEAVNKALREFIARREQAAILDLFGTLEWSGGVKHERSRSEV